MWRKIAGVVLVIFGAVLIGSALLLYLYNDREAEEAGEAAQELLIGVQEAIAERAEAQPELPEIEDAEMLPGEGFISEEELDVVYVDGYDYIGYLTIQDLELVLPVMSDWTYERLRVSPCRQFGNPASDDLVIAAHNYERHFGNLSNLEMGAPVSFTDMNNCTYEYEIVSIQQLDPNDVNAVQNSEHDLVLYTCTYGGKNRVTAFCDRISGEQP